MAASVSGSKTVTVPLAPHLTGAALTVLMGTAIENYTLAQFRILEDAVKRLPAGDQTLTIGMLMP